MRASSIVMRAIHTFNDHIKDPSKLSAYDKAVQNTLKIPTSIILVNPFLDENIGSVSRSMLNYGLTDLRIINPQCNHLSDKAKALAVGSVQILENARLFNSLEDSLHDIGLLFATSGRDRRSKAPVFNPEEAANLIFDQKCKINIDKSVGASRSAIMFGREKGGLNNEEIQYAQAIINIPSYEFFPVLNLAQSVNIICYEIYKKQSILSETELQELNKLGDKENPNASRKDVIILLQRLEDLLSKTNYMQKYNNNDSKLLSEEDMKANVYKDLRNLIFQKSFTSSDVSVLHGVLSSLEQIKKS